MTVVTCATLAISVSQTTSVPCPACGALNEVLVPDQSFDEQMKYAALQFACRACGAALKPADDSDRDDEPKQTSKR